MAVVAAVNLLLDEYHQTLLTASHNGSGYGLAP